MSGGPSGIESDIAIAVGRLTYQKGFDMLLKVWEKVRIKYVKSYGECK
jgi:glycogen synthase